MHSLIREAALGFAPLLAVSLAALPLTAQSGTSGPPPPPPSISTSGVGETSVVPDRAMLNVAVESQGQTAAAAGAENAKLQAHVIDAVKAAGVAAAQIRTSGYNVYPEYAQSSGKAPRESRVAQRVQITCRVLIFSERLNPYRMDRARTVSAVVSSAAAVALNVWLFRSAASNSSGPNLGCRARR